MGKVRKVDLSHIANRWSQSPLGVYKIFQIVDNPLQYHNVRKIATAEPNERGRKEGKTLSSHR